MLVELGKLVREMLVIPLQLWLAIAEPVGALVLAAWRRVLRPALALTLALIAATYRFALAHVTPARGVAVVALVAIGVLAASQWVDYRSVSVGSDAYSGGVEVVAPAPQVAAERAGDSHSWVMLPLAAAALVILALSLTGRPRLARLLVLIGLAVIAIAILVDVPNGLDEGETAIAYQGASAQLLEGFWLQIAAAAGIIAAGLLLPGYLRPAARRDRARRGARAERDRRRPQRDKRPSDRKLPIGEART